MACPVFQNIDESGSFHSCLDLLQQANTKNFVVKFNTAQASCAVDLDDSAIKASLKESNEHHTTWLNFWGWDDRQTIISIAKRYDVSPRLIGLLCPKRSGSSKPSTTPALGTMGDGLNGDNHKDLEKCIVPLQYPPGNATSGKKAQQMPKFKDVVKDLWHFSSVDWGDHYLYIGFNALFTLPEIEEDAESSKPTGIRIWTSVLLCDDGTVLSVFETPDLEPKFLPAFTQRQRQNVLNVFHHLSSLHVASDDLDSLMKITIRPHKVEHLKQHSPSPPQNTAAAAWESASLLFYYLFDDWVTTYSLISRQEHPYREKLDRHRQHMFQTADVKLIQSLHQVGRQLTVLKLMYQSYDSIVTSLLHRHRVMRNATGRRDTFNTETNHYTRQNSLRSEHLDEEAEEAMDPLSAGDDSGRSVRLSVGAIVRFERLVDRIRLYALSEIEECLAEKSSLDFMTFNLVQLKESQSVEKLTRTTILLAKATILFLPVSLMTAFFSIQIGNIDMLYGLKTYWVCFLVVVVLSLGILYVIGIANGTVKGKSIYTSVSRPLWEQLVNKRKRG